MYDNVGCIIINTTPLNFNFLKNILGGGQPSYNNQFKVVEAKEEDEKEEEKKEKKEKEKEDNKIGVAEKKIHYCHAWCRFVIAILGLAKGVPFADLFFSMS